MMNTALKFLALSAAILLFALCCPAQVPPLPPAPTSTVTNPVKKTTLLAPKQAASADRLNAAMFVPPPGFRITITRQGGLTVPVTISWKDPAYLQTAPSPLGPWTTRFELASPYSPSGSSGYFRLRTQLVSTALSSSVRIAVRADGTHAVPVWHYATGNGLAVWKTESDYREIRPFTLGVVDSTWCAWAGDGSLICATQQTDAVHVREFTVGANTATLNSEWTFGDGKSYYGSACTLTNGGVGLVFACDTSPDNIGRFDVAYRAPGGAHGSHRYDLGSYTGSSLPYVMDSHLLNGDLCCHFTRDSAAAIGKIVFKVSGGQLTNSFYDPGWLQPNQGDISVSGEFPMLTVSGDLLIYQNQPHTYTQQCTDTNLFRITSRYAITRESAGGAPQLVAVINRPAMHTGFFPMPALRANPDGSADWLVDYYDPSVCKWGLHYGHASLGVATDTGQMAADDIWSRSTDGWAIYTAGGVAKLLQL